MCVCIQTEQEKTPLISVAVLLPRDNCLTVGVLLYRPLKMRFFLAALLLTG